MASLAYERLWAVGYRNLRVLDEGIPGWIEQGFPTEGRVSGYVPNHAHDYAVLLGRPAGGGSAEASGTPVLLPY